MCVGRLQQDVEFFPVLEVDAGVVPIVAITVTNKPQKHRVKPEPVFTTTVVTRHR